MSTRNSLGSFFAGQKAQLRNLALLVMAFFVGLTAAQFVKLPFKNPYDISNPYNVAGHNPDGNFYVVLFIIVATLALFLLFSYIYKTKYAFILKPVVIVTLLVNYFLTQLVLTYGYTAPDGIVDSFHAGEQLSAAHAFMSGVPLYDHMFFLRGAGVDAVIPAIGLSLFGDSVGGFIHAADSLELLAQLSFFVLLACLVRNPIKFTAIATLLYLSNATSLVQFRDITVWIVIGLLFVAFKKGLSVTRRNLALAALGFLASITLYISIDRGILLLALGVILSALLVVIGANKKNVYAFEPRAWKANARTSLVLLGGLLGGIALPGLFLGANGFGEFMRMTFVDIPRYGGLLVSQPLPAMFSDQLLFWAPVFVAIAAGYLLYWLSKSMENGKLNVLVPFGLVLLVAVLCLKAGSNRIHITKMASVTAPLYLIALVMLAFAVSYALAHKRVRDKLFLPITLLAVVLVGFSQLDVSKILYTQNYARSQFSAYKNLPDRPNDSWISPETKQIKDFILKNTDKDDKIFAFTANPFYYYLTDHQNATRFYVSWFADPQPYTDELLAELKVNKPSAIIYSDSTWMDAPDTVGMADRIPEVNDWILKNYPTKHQVGGGIILTN